MNVESARLRTWHLRSTRVLAGLAMWQLLVALAAGFVLFAGAAGSAAAQGRDLLVFAAASLKNALDEVNADYRRQTGRHVVVSYAASPALARQIEAGAPADVFISA